MCADAAVMFRRQTATAAWGRARPGQGDHEGGTLPNHGQGDGAHARGPQDQHC